jgi:hypothetical protein
MEELYRGSLIKAIIRKLHNFYYHLNITGIGRSRIMRWASNVVPVGERTDVCKLRSVNWTERDQVSHPGTDSAVISKYTIKMGSVCVE